MTPTIDLRALALVLTAVLATSPVSAQADDNASQPRNSGLMPYIEPMNMVAIVPPQSTVSAQPSANTLATAALGRALIRNGIALPVGGVVEACAGIRSLGNCITAMHLAKNLKVTGGFAAVRSIMTYDEGASLGDVIRELAPEADPAAAEKLAREQAAAEMRQAGGNLAAL
jgi:hypothetical protein